MCAALLDDDLDRLLDDFFEQWNIAERRIKKAEQVRANEVVASAIFELRYAGRKLVDALEIARTNNWRNDREAKEKIHRYLADGMEDCVKAKHDAIDATLDFVTRWFHTTEESLGLRTVKEFFPDYLEKTGRIRKVQEQIADSRGNRSERDTAYNRVEDNDYDDILELFDRMNNSRNRVEQTIKKERFQSNLLLWSGILGPIIGIVSIIIAIAVSSN